MTTHADRRQMDTPRKLPPPGAPLQGRAMIAYHNSWAYFARRFRLNIVDLIEPRPGVPPSPAHLAKLMRSMREALAVYEARNGSSRAVTAFGPPR